MAKKSAAAGLIRAENQVYLGAGETLMAKECFEQWLWELAVAKICQLHSRNGIIFNTELFVEACMNKYQTQSFSGVGAHHQNGLAERSIQTIMYVAPSFPVYVSLHRSEYWADNLSLWGIDVKHAVLHHSFNPNHLSGLTPLELFTKTKANVCDLHALIYGLAQTISLIKATGWAETFQVELLITYRPIFGFLQDTFFSCGQCPPDIHSFE